MEIKNKNKVIPEICSREYTPCVKAKRLISPTETLGDDGMAEVPDYNLRGRHHIKAFTLIEVLVVVLIIGILAAVALPQYNIAVNKTRFSTYRTMADSIAKTAQTYYLSTGTWPDSFDVLDVNLPSGMTKNATGTTAYNDSMFCQIWKPQISQHYGQIRCSDKENYTLAYNHIYADANGSPILQLHCSAIGSLKAICLSLGGKSIYSPGEIYSYRLPGSQGY